MRITSSRRSGRPDQLKFVLPDLRAADPSFLSELRDGRIALASGHVTIGTRGAFDTPMANEAVRRELYSFGWLRHLHGSRTSEAEDLARQQLLTWSRSTARRIALAHEPAVAARRAMSLLSHVEPALAGASARDFDQIMDLLADEFTTLGEETTRMPKALPRLTALIALTAYHVCGGIDDARGREASERRLGAELNRQILADGGHLSRNPAALVTTALDLIPLQRAYVSAQLAAPEAIGAALVRMRRMLDLLSHGDQQIGRFNGMGQTTLTDVALVHKLLPVAQSADSGSRHASDTGYLRLQTGDAVVLFDGGPGAETLPGDAPFAGALSFEFSAGRAPLIVNCGNDQRAGGTARLDARATVMHSALVIENTSSAPPTGAREGSTKATLDVGAGDLDAGSATIKASNDGYRQRFGLVHQRTLSLLRDGWLLEGTDRLERVEGANGAVAFAIHFHLHPTVHVATDATQKLLRLTAADGSRWTMTASGADVAIEPSMFLAGASGPKTSLQVVLKGRTATAEAGSGGDSAEVRWQFERMSPAAVS